MKRRLVGDRNRGKENFRIVTVFLIFCAIILLGALPAWAVMPDAAVHKDQKAVTIPRLVNINEQQGKKAEKKYKEGEILVKFTAGVSESGKKGLHKKHGSEMIKEISSLRIHHLKLKKGLAVAEAVKLYKADPDVEYAEPNYIVHVTATTPNDPYYNSTGTWGQPYQDMWGLHKLQTGSAWDITKGSPNVIVAVSDTGLDFTHPDIQGNIWVNTGEIPGNGIDDDNNGYVDDVNGWNFFSKSNSSIDDHGHGTHVSGTITATSDNGTGIPGISWHSKIMPVKFMGAGGWGYISDGVSTIIYAVDNGAKVINCSWGGPGSQVLEDAVTYAFQKGAVVVAAAGNDAILASLSYPAGCENVITVAATDYQDHRAWFTNYGPAVEVSAPGVDILSLRAAGTNMGSPVGTDYTRANGTSMAAPHVSGLAALLFAQNPSWSANKVIGQIIGTTDDIGDSTIGTGRINALSALTSTPSTFIRYVGRLIDDAAGNGDGQINPGETINLSVTVKNITAFSSGVTARLSSTDPNVTILQDNASFGDLNPWSTVDNKSNPFIVSIASETPKLHKLVFTLTVSANGGAYSVSETLEENASFYLPGWPVKTGAPTANHPALADIDNDGRPEVIIGSDKIYVIKGDGTFAAGWPQELPDEFEGWNSLTAGDLDRDGKLEIVSAGWKQIYAWKSDGTTMPGFPVDFGDYPFFTQTSLADLDSDGDLEIISMSHSEGKVYAWHHDGTTVAGWPVAIATACANFFSSMQQATGDIDGDGKLEVIVPTMDGKVYALNHNGTVVSGWPKIIADPIYTSLADINNDGRDEVFIGTAYGQLYGIYGNGSFMPGWPQTGVAPVIGDIDGDGTLEIATNSGNNSVYVYRSDGTGLQGWPQNTLVAGQLPPVLGDIDGDGRIELMTRDYSNHIYAWHADGTPVPEYPITINSDDFYDPYSNSSLALGDINGDGLIDMITGSGALDNNIYAYTLTGTYAAQNVPWPMYLHDSRRSANLNNPAIVTSSLTAGAVDTPYSSILQAKRGSLPYTWSIISGILPAGLQLDQQTGEISGTPTVGGIFKFTVQVVDAAFMKAAKSFSLTITGSAPDMIIAALTAPSTAGSGMSITITDTTRNNGQSAAAASTTRFYLSTNATIDSSDVQLGSRAVPSLAAGEENTGTISAIIPAGTPTRIFYVIARADDGNAVPELYETNNTLYRGLAIGPDLIVSTLSVPAAAGAGMSISIADSTKNNGGGDTGPSTTKFYLSFDTALDSNDRLLGGRALPALVGGEISSGTTTVTIPADTVTNTYYIIAKADVDEFIVETSELNNTRYSNAIKIGPDLTVSAVTAPSAAGAGKTITVSDTTKNNGQGAVPESKTYFYLSMNTTFDSTARLIGSRTVPALAGGESSSGETSVTIPVDAKAQAHYIIAKADGDDLIEELNESNNLRTSYAIKIGPDLFVSAITVPSSSGAGKSIIVTDTTKNIGAGDAGPSTTKYYLSFDTTLDMYDKPLGGRPVDALAAGAISSGTATVTIPADTVTAAYYVIARADGDDLVAELYETNNTRYSGLIKIGPDLTVSALSAPSVGGAGKSITITDTTKNSGAGDAVSSVTGFYLSSDAILDGADVKIGSRTVNALIAGSTSQVTTTVTIPVDTLTGTYYIMAKADGDDLVPEISETNNTKYSASIKIGPDLTVSAMTVVPTTAVAGTSIAVTDTTRNSGAGDAGPSITRFYLSTDTVFDANDVELGYRIVYALAAGASSQVTTSLTVPTGTVGGTYYIIAKADTSGIIPETSETNNTWYRGISILP